MNCAPFVVAELAICIVIAAIHFKNRVHARQTEINHERAYRLLEFILDSSAVEKFFQPKFCGGCFLHQVGNELLLLCPLLAILLHLLMFISIRVMVGRWTHGYRSPWHRAKSFGIKEPPYGLTGAVLAQSPPLRARLNDTSEGFQSCPVPLRNGSRRIHAFSPALHRAKSPIQASATSKLPA